MVGKGEWSIRFAVASKVSDQSSIGPKGVFDQSWARMRPDISLCPVIGVSARAVMAILFMDLDISVKLATSIKRIGKDCYSPSCFNLARSSFGWTGFARIGNSNPFCLAPSIRAPVERAPENSNTLHRG